MMSGVSISTDNRKPYRTPRLHKLGLLRRLTRFSF